MYSHYNISRSGEKIQDFRIEIGIESVTFESLASKIALRHWLLSRSSESLGSSEVAASNRLKTQPFTPNCGFGARQLAAKNGSSK